MRIAIELVVGINAACALIGLALRRLRRPNPPAETHAEYQARLRRENEEIDRDKKELGL